MKFIQGTTASGRKAALSALSVSALLAASLAACGGGSASASNTPPAFQVSIVSPAAGASLARGEGAPGAGSFNGTGFSINLQIVTRDAANVAAL